jgi:hypothetical protein
MKVYCVFWSENEEDVLDIIFKEKQKAREYIEQKYKSTDLGWFIQEMEVEE